MPVLTLIYSLHWLTRALGFRAAVGAMLVVLLGGRVSTATTPVELGKKWSEDNRVSIDKIDHEKWNQLVKRYVDSKGNVDYGAWSNDQKDVAVLDSYLGELSRAEPSRPAQRSARLAFWINAYNAVVVEVLINQPPTPQRKRSLPEGVWTDWVLVVGAKQYSLTQIENDELRKLQDPRIHFAIVCGAKGCPRLRSEAYQADSLDAQLAENSRDFFADPSKLDFDAATNELHLSPILKWYAEDFGSEESDRLQRIAPYLPKSARQTIGSSRVPTIKYLDYDTDVNEQTAPTPPQSAK